MENGAPCMHEPEQAEVGCAVAPVPLPASCVTLGKIISLSVLQWLPL